MSSDGDRPLHAEGGLAEFPEAIPDHDLSEPCPFPGTYFQGSLDGVYNRHMHDVLVYSRSGCHLCDIVKETLAQAQGLADFQWREVDIDADPQLRQQYNDEVPVVFIDGRKAFKYRMERGQFLRALAARR